VVSLVRKRPLAFPAFRPSVDGPRLHLAFGPGKPPSPRVPWGRAGRWARRERLWLVVAVLALMVVPLAAPTSTLVGSAHAAAVPASSVTPSPGSTPGSPSSLPTSGANGQSPVGEPRVPAAIRAEPIFQNQSQPIHPLSPSELPHVAAPTDHAAPASGGSASTAASAPSTAGSASVSSGYIVGVVVDSRPPFVPLAGVTVSANPLAGFCPTGGCVPVETDPTGAFKVLASAGENVVLLTDPYYMSNRTWAYVNTNGITDTGTTELIHDGYVTGVVRADDPVHEPLGGILITAQTRDGTFEALPQAHTDSAGRFTAAVPPVPSELTFASLFPYSPYESNNTWVNASAGATIDLGTVYLEKTTTISITIYDASNGLLLGAPTSIQVTSKATQYEPAQGAVQGGPTITAPAPVGPDSAVIYALGYLVDPVSLGVVPATAPGAPPVFMGNFYLVPLGGIIADFGISGGMTSPAVQKWGFGQAVVSACTLDGESTASLTPSGNYSASSCTGGCDSFVGQYVEFSALPLRNYITVVPDTSGVCSFGATPTWPIPGMVPVFENWAWANVTPNYAVDIGHVDLLAGTYVMGQVLPASDTGWTVNACSTDEPNVCGPGVFSDLAYQGDYSNTPPTGCPAPVDVGAGTTFCVPVPPGPDRILVSSNNASANYTWVEFNPVATSPLPLPMSSASLGKVQSINLTTGHITGRVLQSRSLTPLAGLPAVQACPAGTAPGAVACLSGVANQTGYFSIDAPLGWDRVTVSATNFAPNSTWVWVRYSNATGTILLTPYGFINGQVVNGQGVGIYEATVSLCPVTKPTGCAPLGADGGLTSTDGRYFGSAPAGSLPLGAYAVEASAPGYETDWTWVNLTTPGQNFTAPTIVLPALPSSNTSGTGSEPRNVGRTPSAPAPTTAFGSWVTGRVVDAVNGLGLPDAAVTATSVLGGAPNPLSSVRGTGGEFNDSLPVGEYAATVSVQGFYPTTFAFNVTGNDSVVSVGTIPVVPFPTVTGQVVIDPWRVSVTQDIGLGPGQATVSVCSSIESLCGPGVVVDTSGYFNVSAPVGNYDTILAQGGGTGTGTYNGGFVANSTFVNVTSYGEAPGPKTVIGLPIFGVIVGSVIESGSRGSTPVSFDSIVASSNSPTVATYQESLNSTGDFAIFFPPSQILNMTAGGAGAWIPRGASFSVDGNLTSKQPFLLGAGGVANLDARSYGPSFALLHFGWIDARVVNVGSGLPIPYATLSAGEPGQLWGLPTAFTASGVADGDGFLNVSAPPSLPSTQPISVNLSSPDHSFVTTSTFVNSSRTTFLNGTSLAHLHGFALLPWGWVAGTVRDAATGVPLAGASPIATDPNGQTGTTSIQTSGKGYFFIDAPPSPTDHVSIQLSGYESNNSFQNVGYGAIVTVAPVPLLGNGVVQGVVLAAPGGSPVPGVSVTVCPRSQPNCVNRVSTNLSGFFAVAAPPGTDVVTVSANGFVSNAPVYLSVPSDTWTWVGAITIYRYSFVAGMALGLPGGGPVAGANASLCALPPGGGAGAGPCFATVVTGADGSFQVEAPAGSYVLQVNATFYNNTYLEVSVVPGETLPVGTIFLDEYGTTTGRVLASDTGAPLVGARLAACEMWGSDLCRPTVFAGPGGQFVVSGPAGPYSVEASATGYLSAFERVTLPSGGLVHLADISLIPVGPDSHFLVSGSVNVRGTDEVLPDAIVSATGGFSTTTDASGDYSLLLPWGTTTLTAGRAGYLSVQRSLSVVGPVTDENFSLVVATYAVTGSVHDGLTGLPVANVSFLTSYGAPSPGHSGADGSFAFLLGNGTFSLVAVPTAASGYGRVPFTVTVNGGPTAVSLTVYPATVTLNGLVANALTGASVPGATVTIVGTTTAGVPWHVSATSGPDGRFTVRAYSGDVALSAAPSGYEPVTVKVTVPLPSAATSLPVTLGLSPMSGSVSASPLAGWGAAWLAAGVGGAAAVGAVLWMVARRPPRTRPVSASPPLDVQGE